MEIPPPFHEYPRPKQEKDGKVSTPLIIFVVSMLLIFCGLPIGCMILIGPD